MAARLNKRLADQTRDAIQTSMLINRLTDHIFGEVELSATQVRGIEVLLRKTLPDLKATEHSGEVDAGITVKVVKFGDCTPEQLET